MLTSRYFLPILSFQLFFYNKFIEISCLNLFKHNFLTYSLWWNLFIFVHILYSFLFCILLSIAFFKYFFLHTLDLVQNSNDEFNFCLIDFFDLILINLVVNSQLKSLWYLCLLNLSYHISFAINQVVNSILKNQLNCLVWKSDHMEFVFWLVWYLFDVKWNLSRVKRGFKQKFFFFKFKCVWRLPLTCFKFCFTIQQIF